MKAPLKPYTTPAIETLESSEILELVGPVQGYGPGNDLGSSGNVSNQGQGFVPLDGPIRY